MVRSHHWYHISAEGDSALIVRFGDTIADELVEKSHKAAQAIRAAKISGVTDIVEGYASVLVCYNPLELGYPQLCALIAACLDHPCTQLAGETRTIEIPVCYGADHGPDIDDVAAYAGLSIADVIALHTRPSYKICMIGFLPGFPYLAGLDERLACPRLNTPRTRVPAGSVGIAGSQTGVYPITSPGGWRLIGQTPLKLFDPKRSNPVPYRAGDMIRFVPIDATEFERISAAQHALDGLAGHEEDCRS